MKTMKKPKTKTKRKPNPKPKPKPKTTKNQKQGGGSRQNEHLLRDNIKIIHHLLYKNHHKKTDTDKNIYLTVETLDTPPQDYLKREIKMSLSQWYIDPEKLGDFTSAIHGSLTPMDCAISAMQTIGFITEHESNLLRINLEHGIRIDNIIKMFTYISIHKKNTNKSIVNTSNNIINTNNNIINTNNNIINTNNKIDFSRFHLYDLIYFSNKEDVIDLINTLKDSHICFVGHVDKIDDDFITGHAYCFFNNQNDIYLIDPQNKDYTMTLCNNNNECQNVMNKGLQSNSNMKRFYFTIFRSQSNVSESNIKKITNAMGFDLYRHGRRIY